MRTETMIIIGGFGRAGTNTVSQYLHLNDKIFAFMTGSEDEMSSDFKHYVSCQGAQVPQLRFDYPKHKEILSYIGMKNRDRERYGAVDHYPFISRKHEEIEIDPDKIAFFENLNMNLKFIFCVRSDFNQLYLSRKEIGHDLSVEGFTQMCWESFESMQVLGEKYLSCCIDVTDNCAYLDYDRIDRMLKISRSPLQEWWRNDNPKTNWRNPTAHGPRSNFELPEYETKFLRECYYKTRARLI
jgi:hypothetical protein